MLWEQSVQYASHSDVGLRRENNEDASSVRLSREKEAFVEHGHLFVVADGMGGHAVGELASKLAVETVPLSFFKSRGTTPDEALRRSIMEANRVINERGAANLDFRRMGTTCSTLLLCPQGAVVGHVGDSRVYRVRDHRIDQLTFDHSLQWELRRGRKAPTGYETGESRNVITRSLGPEAEVDVDVEGPFPVVGGDAFLLCSDGLVSHVTNEEIGATIRSLSPEEACRLLVDLALLRGGTDNVTVLVVHVGRVPSQGMSETATALTLPTLPRKPVLPTVLAVLLVVAGVTAAVAGDAWDVGSVLGVIGVAIGVASFLVTRRRFEFARASVDGDGSDTVLWKPYASASAQLTRPFLERLDSLDAELRSMAREEGWTVDWDKHDEFASDARVALERDRLRPALTAVAKAIDQLVRGVVAQRNRLVHEARWGKPAK